MLVPRTFRQLGVALACLGAVLVLIATSLTILIAPRLSSTNRGPAGIWFIGGVFFLLFLVGLIMMTAGISQGLTGRRNQRLMTGMITTLIALALLAMIGRALL